MTHRLLPLTPPYPADVAALLANYPQQEGYILSLFRTFANSVRFLKKGVPNLLDKESPLPLRIRELVILRTTANNKCEYEWGVHVAIFAKAARLNGEQIAATCMAEVDATLWTNEEANVLQAIDDLCNQGRISDAILGAFQAIWTKEQQLEIFALCGTYHTISFVANSARLDNEAFGVGFPANVSILNQ